MTEIEEGDLKFTFPDHCEAHKYDEWAFYRNQFQSVAGGSKAVDIVCVSGDTAWLIEIKDYRRHPRTKVIDIDDELARKVRDTLAGWPPQVQTPTSMTNGRLQDGRCKRADGELHFTWNSRTRDRDFGHSPSMSRTYCRRCARR